MRHPPVKRPVFHTGPLLYAKDQCDALPEGKIGEHTLYVGLLGTVPLLFIGGL